MSYGSGSGAARLLPAAAACVLLLAGSPVRAAKDEAQRPADSQAIHDLLQEGLAFLREGNPRRARRSFAKADRQSAGQSIEARFGLARADLALEQFDGAIEDTRQLLEHDLPADVRAQGLQLLAIGLLSREVHRPVRFPSGDARKREPAEPPPVSEDLLAAEETLRSAIEASGGRLNSARYYLAEVLTRQRKDGEALEVLREYFERGVDPGAEGPAEDLRTWLECVRTNAPVEPRAGAEVTYPELVKSQPPEYPAEAREAGLQGSVVLAAVVDTEGDVRCILPWRRAPAVLTNRAIETVRRWKYSPGRQDGEPVSIYFVIVVDFILQGSRR